MILGLDFIKIFWYDIDRTKERAPRDGVKVSNMSKLGKILVYCGNNINTLSGWRYDNDLEKESRAAFWDDFTEDILGPFCEALGGGVDDFDIEYVK